MLLYIITNILLFGSFTFLFLYGLSISPTKTNILEGSLGRLSGVANVAGKLDDSGIVLSAEVIEDCKLTEHPLENGQVLADNKVIMPTEINVQITLPAQDYKDKLETLKKYKDENQMIYVETKFGSYPNMQIVNIPCNMNINNINRLTFNIKLREVLVAGRNVPVTENVSDMNTINTGTQTGIIKSLSFIVSPFCFFIFLLRFQARFSLN